MEQRIRLMSVAAALVAVVLTGIIGVRALAGRDAASAPETTAAGTGGGIMLADRDATVYGWKGKAVALTEIADGKPLVINFWATWCPYCIDELPDFQTIVAIYSDRVSFAFVDVCDGDRETVKRAKRWVREEGFKDLPIYFDKDLAASTAFAAYALPTTVVVSAEGEVLTVSAGRIDPALLCSTLERLV